MTEKKGIRIWAIAIGLATDLGGSVLAGTAYGVVLTICMLVRGISPETVATRLQGPVVEVPGLLIGFGFTLLGGFVAGRIAKRSEILHGGIVGGIGLPLGFLFCAALPLWYNIISFAGIIPVGMVGGYLALQRNRKAAMTRQTKPDSRVGTMQG